MPTVIVQATPRADLSPDDFADITPAVCKITPHPNGSDVILEFDADLTTEQQGAVMERASMPTTERTIRAQAEQALANLRTVRDSTGTLTNDQLSQAVRLLARIVIALVRLVLRRLDSTD